MAKTDLCECGHPESAHWIQAADAFDPTDPQEAGCLPNCDCMAFCPADVPVYDPADLIV